MKFKHFSIEERELIQEMKWGRKSTRAIAEALGRSPSSISRELNRNYPECRKTYLPRLAHERALEHRMHRGRTRRLKNERIRSYVIHNLKRRWSPEQISGRIKTDLKESISYEAIYQFIYAQIHRGGYGCVKPGKEDLRMYLRRRRKRRVPKGTRRCQRALKPKGISINLRPAIVAKRKRIGDWESDSVESRDHKPGVNTLLERKTGMYLISKLQNKTARTTASVIESRLKMFPNYTITFDNGTENSDWQSLEKTLSTNCFFANPYHSWERGANENANGLLRDYFPKKTDFTTISDEELAFVEYELNSRPRKRLGWRTPLEAMSVAFQS